MRLAIVAALALGCAFQVVRSAAVSLWVTEQPDRAARFWPRHPQVQFALSMAEIGQAAAAGKVASAPSIARAMAAAKRAPLAVEPFLIAGAAASAAGKPAMPLFVEARRRDPRSPAARYFLAQYDLSSGRVAQGLNEASILSRLVPGGAGALVPGLAIYARSPGAVANLKRMIAGNPALGEQLLALLAQDASNADMVVALAGDVDAASGPTPAWQAQLLHALVERGDYQRAYALWRRVSGLPSQRAGLFNPRFDALRAPPPFDWTLSSGDFGVAEPASPAGLQVIYYGRADAEFARQTLLLAPGDYALAMEVNRDAGSKAPGVLAWSVDCAGGGRHLLSLPLMSAPGAPRAFAARFSVPPACPAQVLRLTGTAREFAETEQAVISKLRLARVER